jgi:hypothetical protein
MSLMGILLRGGLASACLALLAGTAGAAQPGRMTASYTITISGITVGGVEAETRITGSGYAMSLRGFTSGVSRLVSDATTLMASNGRIGHDRVLPANYTLETTEEGDSASVRMHMRSGNIIDLNAFPGLIQAPDRVPVTAADKENIVDPLSAFIIPTGNAGAPDGSACNRTLPVFDGYTRFDVTLGYVGERKVKAKGYSGPVAICSVRYTPIAGHRRDRPATKFMADNRDMEVWLAPIAGTNALWPYRVSVRTMIGTITGEATEFRVDK